MKSFLLSVLFSTLIFTNLLAEVIQKIYIEGNKRISKETIKIYGEIEIGKNYNDANLNRVLNNLYRTEFFEDVKISVVNGELKVKVK